MIRFILKIAMGVILVAGLFLLFTLRPIPNKVTYGVTFSILQAQALGEDWHAVYLAALDDLKIRDLRIPAYWPQVEPSQGQFDWTDLDFEMNEALTHDAHVVLAVGRRLPRWPECHTPEWAQKLSWDDQKKELRAYVTAVVDRYKDNSAITYWQVENEPYLSAFGECGPLDEGFLKEEVALVHSLDTRPVLVTDSGNLGTWWQPYRDGDAFGTSLYMYFWNPQLGEFKTKLPAMVYRAKERLMQLLFGTKPTFLIELSLEPWLVRPTQDAPLDEQLSRMDIDKFNEIIAYARKTSFDEQYLWGVEWWYYMKGYDHPEFWAAAKKLYNPAP